MELTVRSSSVPLGTVGLSQVERVKAPATDRRKPYSHRMLTFSTLVPVAAGLFVAGHVLVSSRSAKREHGFRAETMVAVGEEAIERFPDDVAACTDWRESEMKRRLEERGYEANPIRATYASVQAAAAMDRGTLSTGQQVDQWILITSAVAGVVLMGFGL